MHQHDPYTPIIESLRHINCCETEDQFKENLRRTRSIMRDLRMSYKGCSCTVDYSCENTRAAYMLGYYPYYIEIIYEELSKLPPQYFPSTWQSNSINACFFGGGPCPEIIGWLAFLSDHFPNIRSANAFVFDKFNDSWKVCREITKFAVAPNYWNGEVNILPIPIDLFVSDKLLSKDSITAIQSSNLLVMQNFLNDQPGTKHTFTNYAQIINNLLFIFDQAPADSIILVTDLNFPRSQSLMATLEREIQKQKIAIPILSVNKGLFTITPSISSNDLLNELFTGENGLIKKGRTNYFSSLFYKSTL